jgi:ligand-binding sensor domain-containing protein
VSNLTAVGNKLYAGTDNGIYLSINNGKNWDAIDSGIPPWTIVWCFAIDGNNFWFYNNYYNAIFYSANAGSSWSSISTVLPSSPNIRALAVQDSFLIAGTESGIFRSLNNGLTWFWASSGLPANIYVHTLFNIGKNLLAGTNQGVFISFDNGISWTAMNSKLPITDIYSFAVIGKYLFAGTGNGVWRMSLSSVYVKNAPKVFNDPLCFRIKATNHPDAKVIIQFSLTHGENVALSVFNASGRKIADLVNESLYAGMHTISWAALGIPSGLYIVQIRTESTLKTHSFSLF